MFTMTEQQQKFFASDHLTSMVQEIDYTADFAIMKYFPIAQYPDKTLKSEVTLDTRKIFKDGFKAYRAPAHPIARKERHAKQVTMIPFSLSTDFEETDLLGQNVALTSDIKQKIEYYLSQYTEYLKKGIDYTLAWANWQILKTGSFEVSTSAGITYNADFGIANWQTKELTANDRWSQYTQPDSTPLADIEAWRREAHKKGAGVLKELVMNSATFETFAGHPSVKELMGERFKELAYQGLQSDITIKGYKISLVDDYYEEEDNDTPIHYLADGEVIAKVDGPLGETALGTTEITDDKGFKTVFGVFSKSYITNNPDGLVLVSGMHTLPNLKRRYSFIKVNTEAS